MLAGVEVEHEVGEGALEACSLAEVDDEARAGDFGGAVEVEDAEGFTEFPVRLGGEGEGWDGAPGFFDAVVVLGFAERDGGAGEIGERLQDLLEALVGGCGCLLERVGAVFEGAGLGHDGFGILPGALEGGDFCGEAVALGLEGFKLGDGVAALGVDGVEVAEERGGVCAAAAEAVFKRAEVCAYPCQIQHKLPCYRLSRWGQSSSGVHSVGEAGIYHDGMRLAIRALSAVLCLAIGLPAHADAYHAQPKLVVVLVIDQFRGDLLERYRDDLKTPNGFNLFLRRGAYFNNCYYGYANTKTAPGHATIGTGAYTDGHGIGSNEWWDLTRNLDRPVSSVEDARYRLVGDFADLPVPAAPAPKPTDARIGASPFNLKATTIGDEVRLATQGQSKLFGISLKDRASILPSGHTANGAFWIDQATGRFVTSTYYMKKMPEWASAFNLSGRAKQAAAEAGVPDTTQFYSLVGRTTAANAYELDFAEALINGEKLGRGKVTDVLTVSLSANDILGHQMGPDSDNQREMVLGLDKQLNAFFTWLDKTVGLANVTIAFTADHGIAPIPSESRKLGVPSASLDLDKFGEALNEALNVRFKSGNVNFLMPTQELPYIALDERVFELLKITEVDAENAVVRAVPLVIRKLSAPMAAPDKATTLEADHKFSEERIDSDPQIAFVRSKLDLAAGRVPQTEFGQLIAHSYSEHGGWYVMMIPTAYQMEYLNSIQTTHFSPWSYDRHVPMAFYGRDFVPGVYREHVAPVDIAATLASLLGVNQPSASVGRVLVEALKPVRMAAPTQSVKPKQ